MLINIKDIQIEFDETAKSRTDITYKGNPVTILFVKQELSSATNMYGHLIDVENELPIDFASALISTYGITIDTSKMQMHDVPKDAKT